MADVSRALDSPLTTRACADFMGYTSEWIRGAIDEGVVVRGTLVKLEAETIRHGARRRTYRIHADKFVEFLRALGWSRLPALPQSQN